VRVGGVLSVLGQKALHAYLVNEIQEIYRLPVCRRLRVGVNVRQPSGFHRAALESPLVQENASASG
jgi:hypothetical protein